MIIGITGGTGCGKTTLLELIRERGGMVFDCDAVYHRLLADSPKLMDQIRQRFPDAFENGIFHRKKLGNLVFSDPDALKDLNSITHKAVTKEILRQLETQKPVLAAIDAIALFEAGMDRLCDVTVAVSAPTEARIRRLILRDNIDRDYARKRIDAQHSAEWFAERCDALLYNDASEEDFRKKCLAFLDTILV